MLGNMNYTSYGVPCDSCSLSTPFGFAGGYTDLTGLVYLVHRYYDSATAQFMTVDPAVAETRQPYSYANDDAVNDVDPLGLFSLNPIKDIAEAWDDTGGKLVHQVKLHWRGIAQIATLAAAGSLIVACDVTTVGACLVANVAIAVGASDAFYAESGGPHTLSGYINASAWGVGAGTIADLCAVASCVFLGSAVLGGILANGIWGGLQAIEGYEDSDVCTSAWGAAEAFANGFVEGGIPWDRNSQKSRTRVSLRPS